MKNFDLTLALVGKRYNDEIVVLDKFVRGETNKISKRHFKTGGIYNIKEAGIDGVHCNCYEYGETDSLIISEIETSTRTSFITNTKEIKFDKFDFAEDWIHISYIDDLLYEKIDMKNFSIDFCTTLNRQAYYDILSKSQIAFDSRERRKLYKNIKVKTPIVLHDERGCEVIIENKIVCEQKINPVMGLNVNGAGDIFAGIFIKHFLKSNIRDATLSAPILTKERLIERNYEKI